MKRKLIIILFFITTLFAGCEKYDRLIQDLNDRIDLLEGTVIAPIEDQIKNINVSLNDLKSVDAALDKLIADLNTEADRLQQQINENASAYAEVTILIKELQDRHEALDQQIKSLESYLDNEIKSMKDWSAATYATLEQYSQMQTEIAAIKVLVDTYKTEITSAYTKAIENAIGASESSMKKWVNEMLAESYYDIASVDALIAAIERKLEASDSTFAEELEKQKNALDQARIELTSAYEVAISEAIKTNNGKIGKDIEDAIKSAVDKLSAEIAAINVEIDAIKSDLILIRQSIASVNQQIDGIKTSIEQLQNVDTTLQVLIASLEAAAKDLQSQLDADSAADAAAKKAIEDDLKAVKDLLKALQDESDSLDQKIAELSSFVEEEITSTEDWAKSTFATLEQYKSLQTEISRISSLVNTYKNEVTEAYTKSIEDAIAATEKSMKDWVNEHLAEGYYSIAEVNAKLTALESKITDADNQLAKQIENQKKALEDAETRLTTVIQQSITDAIAQNGVIGSTIASKISEATSELQIAINTINTEIESIKNRISELEGEVGNLVARIQSMRFISEYSDGKVEFTSDNATVTLTFMVSPEATAKAVAQAFASDPDVLSAYVSRTQPRTKAVDTPASLTVAKVEGTDAGMLAVTVDPSSLPADYWTATREANVFIRISDGNNDVISEMIPAFYSFLVWTHDIEASASVSGNGTKSYPYLIRSANDLQWMIEQVNEYNIQDKHYKLTRDLKIDSEEGATWTPIGTQDNPFVGYFDGGEHTISGEMVISDDVYFAGFFGHVGLGSVISNLTNAADVTSLADESDHLAIGGIAGYAKGHQEHLVGHNGTYIIACHNMGEIKSGISSAYSSTGGIAGELFGGAVVMACSNEGELIDENQYASIGSIVGYCSQYYDEYYESSVLSCLYNSDEYEVTNGVCIDEGNYSFAHADLDELNYLIALFNELNYDYQDRTVVLDKHWEHENGSFVLKDGAPKLGPM